MTKTLGGFCHHLLDDVIVDRLLNPEEMAARFVGYFGLTLRPTLDELTGLLDEAGFGTVYGLPLEDGLKGAHFGDPGNGYDIYYSEALWEGARDHTILHETYEIIYETLCDLESDAPPDRRVCHEADRFAAAVLMQPETFADFALGSGLDVVALQRHFGRSYASVTLRLAEVMRRQPLLAVLYERREQGEPVSWSEAAPAKFRATVVARTPGFRVGVSPTSWWLPGRRACSGPVPHLRFAGGPGDHRRRDANDEDELAVAAQPVVWNGRLAKVIVVAVPYSDRAALQPQLSTAARGTLTPAY